MSVSSRKLKAIELPALRQAQEEAARIADFRLWLSWMRSTYTYSTAVRMALYMGHKRPDGSFYESMRQSGVKRLKCLNRAARAA